MKLELFPCGDKQHDHDNKGDDDDATSKNTLDDSDGCIVKIGAKKGVYKVETIDEGGEKAEEGQGKEGFVGALVPLLLLVFIGFVAQFAKGVDGLMDIVVHSVQREGVG